MLLKDLICLQFLDGFMESFQMDAKQQKTFWNSLIVEMDLSLCGRVQPLLETFHYLSGV